MSPRKIGQPFDESEEPGLANQINLSVAKGAEKLEAFEKAVEQLISTLKKQHDTMIAFSDARLETAKLFETLVANTPLTKAMGEKDVEKDKAAVFKKKKPAPEQPVDAATIGSTNLSNSETPIVSVKKTQMRSSPSGAEDSRMSKNKADMLPAEDEEITLDTDLVEKTHEDESVDAAEDVKASFATNEEDPLVATSTSNTIIEEDAPVTIPFEKQVTKGSHYAEVDISNLSIAQASHKLSHIYADQYETSIIQYAEEWLQTVTLRIKSGLIEFEKLRESLNHYVAKVAALRAEAEKFESHKKKLSPKKSEKLERNELKLNGAREAHHKYGQSLSLLMDEVTARGWRDLFPLIVNSVHFDLNYSSDQAKLYSKLESISDMLDEAAAADPLGLDIEGRLEQLKKATSEEVYTGKEYTMVHPILKAI